MKRITLLLVALFTASLGFGQSHMIDPDDWQKMMAEREASIVEQEAPSMLRAPKSDFVFPPNFTQVSVGGKNVTGYGWNAYQATSPAPEGPVTVSIPGGVLSSIQAVSSDLVWMTGGDFAEDIWYTTSYDPSNSSLYTVDVTTGNYTLVGPMGFSVTGLAYDPNTGIMYASRYDGSANSYLHTVNLETGAMTQVGVIAPGIIIGIAGDANGNLYGLNLDDNLYSINKTTGAGTVIGPIGYTVNYAQDIGFDRDNNILYGTLYTTSGGLYQFDISTGAATLLNNFIAEVCAFGIPYTSADDDAPAAVAGFTVTPGASGALNAALSWTNPSTTVGGATLSQLSSIVIERNGAPLTTISNPTIGGAGSYTDNSISESGVYTYRIYGVNSAGEGLKVAESAFIGEDVPAAPGDVTLVPEGNFGHVSWTAPTVGLNGGYLSGTGITYRVVRMPGAVEVAEAATGTEFLDTNIPGIGNYYYVVTASNAIGVGGSASSNVALLASEGVVMYETFDYPTGALPPGWVLEGVAHNWAITNTSSAGGSAPELQLNWNPQATGLSRVVTTPISTQGYESLRMKYRTYLNNFSTNEGEIGAIDVSFDGGETWEALWETEITASIPAGQYELYIDVPPGKTDMHLGFRFEGNSYNINNWYFDNLLIEPVLDNDLAATHISGNVTPSEGMESMYTITILNAGTLAQSDYTVKLMKEGGIELASTPGTAIGFGETNTFQLPWTPEIGQTGATYLYGLVVLEGDEFAANNQTPHLNVNVQAGDIVAVTIGTATTFPPNRIPFDFFWKNSLSQTLYYPDEIGIGGGAITSIMYNTNFATNLPGKPVQIWMGETDMEDLSGGWVDPAGLTLVYDGNVDFPQGMNDIIIPLQMPYVYTGGTLVIYSYRVWEDQYFSSSDRFYGTEDPGNPRTRRAAADATVYDPAAPAAGATMNWLPNTTLFFSTAGLGAVEGTVTDGTNPIEGVEVSVVGTMAKTHTDADGFYEFPYLLPGTYDMAFELFGYNSALVEDVEVIAEETVVVNATMEAIPQYSVSGIIIGNDDVLIEGAHISLEGYDSYEVLSAAGGAFTIEGVYAGTYVMEVNAVGYEVFVNDNLVVDANLNLGEIEVIEIIVVPFGLVVDTDNQAAGNALFMWNSGDAEFADSFESGDFDLWHAFVQGPGLVGDDGGNPYWFASTDVDGANPPDGIYVARADWGYQIDTWLITPAIIVEAGTSVVFNWYSSYYWSVDPNPNAELMVKVSTDGGTSWTELWNWQNIGVWTNFTWYETTVDLADYAGQSVHVAFNLVGDDNAVSQIDDIYVGAAGKSGTLAISHPANVAEDARSLPEGMSIDKAFTGFNVFLNGAQVASAISATSYLFTDLAEGEYTAGVQSVYTTGSSDIITVDFDMIFGVPVTVDVSTNSGDSPAGAMVTLVNETHSQYQYSGEVGASGTIAFDNVRKGMYTLHVELAGFEMYEESGISIQNEMTITAVLEEVIVAPFGLLVTTEGLDPDQAHFSWNNAMGWAESFEGGSLPSGWDQIINNNTSQAGFLSTWHITGTVELTTPIVPQDGNYQAFMMWSYGHQDEWLITPEFTAPAGDLVFWYYGTNGSVNADNYYVKVSTNGGNTWTILWNASDLPAGANPYATPAVIDLSSYAGQNIHIAWNNVDGPTNDGLWYAWAIDNISVGDMKIDVRDLMVANGGNVNQASPMASRDGSVYDLVNPADMLPVRDKAMVGYNVFLNNMTSPVAVEITATEFLFTDLPGGTHTAGVQSVYTSGASEIVTIEFTVEGAGEPDLFNVDYFVHMHLADFDPETDVVFITGSMLGWAAPGDNHELQTLVPTEDPMIYHIHHELQAGTYEYKYFLNAGWDGGEWQGGDNREITVSDHMEVHNVFGDINDPVSVTGPAEISLKLFPNPARTVLNVTAGESIRELRVIDMLGQVVYSARVDAADYQISVDQLRDGVYFVQVVTDSGFMTQKVQISK